MAVHRAAELKAFAWENIEVGEELGWVEGIVSDFQIKTHAYAVDDYGDWYLKDSPFGGRIGHPMLLVNDMARLFRLTYDVKPGVAVGLHTRNETELFRPVRLGQKVIIRGTHADKYQKRGRNYRVLAAEVRDEAGELLLRSRQTEIVGFESSAAVGIGQASGTPGPDAITGEVPAGAPVVARADGATPVGAVLPALAKHTTLEQSIAFSGFDYGWVEGGARAMRFSIHTDPAEGLRPGQPGVIVQGLVSNAYLSELCTNFFGAPWLTSGRLSVAFVRPVIGGDDLTVAGLVKRREDEGGRGRLHLDVWCKNQRGELVTVGRASALVE